MYLSLRSIGLTPEVCFGRWLGLECNKIQPILSHVRRSVYDLDSDLELGLEGNERGTKQGRPWLVWVCFFPTEQTFSTTYFLLRDGNQAASSKATAIRERVSGLTWIISTAGLRGFLAAMAEEWKATVECKLRAVGAA